MNSSLARSYIGNDREQISRPETKIEAHNNGGCTLYLETEEILQQ